MMGKAESAEMITFHGWGFSADIWARWDQLMGSSLTLKHADRGYFGRKQLPHFEADTEQKILSVHSFGLHWVPAELLEEANHLVILSGFLDFHPSDPVKNRRSRLVLHQMKSRFVEKPEEVIQTFHRNCWHPDSTSAESVGRMRHDRLLSDLELLDSADMTEDFLMEIPQITIIQGAEDQIVSRSKGRELYSRFHEKSRYLEIKQAGHCAPFTHEETCCRFLAPLFVTSLKSGAEDS